MNCANHPDQPAVAFCRTCGKALCESCRHPAQGTVFCDEHVPVTAGGATASTAAPAPAAATYVYDASVSPGLAAVLGMIPGVGAIYNGQYAKGLVHAIIFGLLISMSHSSAAVGLEGLFVTINIAWWFYMVLEAYHTARKRRAGEPVDEFSSLISLRGGATRFPMGAVVLIVLGVVLLLNTLDVLDFRYIVRYWPALLILIGVYMLYGRMTAPHDSEVHDERR